MTKNKLFLIGGITFLTGLMTLGVITGNQFKNFEISRAEEQQFVLDASATPTISEGNGALAVGEYSNFTYTKASNLSGYHVVLAEGGVMRKTEATNKLKEVKIVFEGSLKFEADYTNDFTDDHFVIYPESNVAVALWANYWKITALESTKITSLYLKYECDEPCAKPDNTDAYVSGMPQTGRFAYLEDEGDDTYLVFNGEMNNGYVASTDLTIRENRLDGEFQYIIDCERVEYRGTNSFAAYFNVSKWYENREIDIDFYAHLYYRNNNWYNGGNDLRTWQDGEQHSNEVIVPSTKTLDSGNKSIELLANSWDNSTGYFYQVRLNFRTTTKHFQISPECASGGSLFDETNVTYTDRYTTITYYSVDRSVKLAPDMFVLCDYNGDNAKNAIVASEVTYTNYGESQYKVDIKFDLTLFDRYFNGTDESNTWCHLLVSGNNKGSAWDGVSGDLKTANTVGSTNGEWAHRHWFKIGNIGYNYWNSWSILIIQLKHENN